MENSTKHLRKYMNGETCCMCGGANFKFFEFKDIVIIGWCQDCDSFEYIATKKYSIGDFTQQGVGRYFCKFNSNYPRFKQVGNDIVQTHGCSIFSKNKFAEKIIHYTPKHIVIKQYKKRIKYAEQDLKKLKGLLTKTNKLLKKAVNKNS